MALRAIDFQFAAQGESHPIVQAAKCLDLLFSARLLPGELAAWPRCVSLAVRMPDDIMDSVRAGPTMPYCDEYLRVNALINELETRVAERIAECGFAVHPIPASDTRDPVRFLGNRSSGKLFVLFRENVWGSLGLG